jgi:hypothetical protein
MSISKDCGSKFYIGTITSVESVEPQAFYCSPSPRVRKIGIALDDFSLSGCHAKVSRTRAVLSEMPPLLVELWREQHPHGHEQTTIDFTTHRKAAQAVHRQRLINFVPCAFPLSLGLRACDGVRDR